MKPIKLFWAVATLAAIGCQTEPTSTEPFLTSSTGEVAVANYVRIDLGTLPGGEVSEAWAINNAGQVVGHSQTETRTDLHAFVWHRGVMRDLGTLPGGDFSRAFDINATGQIAGESRAANGEINAFRWENGVMRDLGNLGHQAVAQGIDNLGQVVGWGQTSGGWHRGFLWQKGELKRLDVAQFVQAFAINNGLIVGWHRTGNHPNQAFVLNKRTGVVTALGTLGGAGGSIAYDVNQEGKVVGGSSAASGGGRAFLWQNGVMRDLGVTWGDGSGATGISPLGHVVGYSSNRRGETRGFVWVNGVITDLGPGMPQDINRAGWIVGNLPDANGRMRATLWKPRSE